MIESAVLDDHALSTPQLLKLAKLTRFFRFLRLLRILKLKQLLYKLEEFIVNETLIATINLLKVVLVVVFIGHWMACIFYQIGILEMDTHSKTWIRAIGWTDSPPDDIYIAALYWAFTTMTTTGYGDIVPITNTEKLFVMFCFLISCGVFAYVVGSVETILRRSGVTE
jgi:hyperpolarization activated cyclic nucleotide-gated potassium channel 2